MDQARDERFSTAALDGVTLRTRHWGAADAPVVVLLHGAGANAHWWDHIAPPLANRLHLVALDFRGHGDSDYPDEHRAGAFSDDLDALLEHLAAPHALLVGHSLGAHVALAHAASQGAARTTPALVLIDPSRGTSPSRARATRLALTLRRTYATHEQAVDRFRFLPGAANASETLRTHIASRSVRREPNGRFGFKFDPHWFGVASRGRPDPGQIACPTLIMRGCESALLTADGARNLCDEIPDARLVEIEDAGHHVHIDRPAEVSAALSDFLLAESAAIEAPRARKAGGSPPTQRRG